MTFRNEATDLTAWIASLYAHPDLVRMGHNQRAADLNLGLGWARRQRVAALD